MLSRFPRRRSLVGMMLAIGGAGALYRRVARRRGAPGAGRGGDTGAGREVARKGVEIHRSLTVRLPRAEVYTRWRDPRMQESVWRDAVEVTAATEDGARWRIGGPLERTVEWETRIVEERHADLIRWQSVGGDLPNDGTVEFRDAPGDWGTEITLRVRFDPPGGAVGETAARLFDEPSKLVLAKALRRFKSLVEAGETPTIERNASARTT